MGLIGLVMGLAPALGPTLSGLVVQDHSWRILFYALLPVVIANLLLAAFSLQNVGERHREKLDYISILLSTTGFAGLLYGVNLAGDQSAPRVWAGAVILSGILFIILFIRRQLKLTVPLLDFRLFKSRSFSLASIIGVLMFIVMVGAELLIPLYVQNVRGLTPSESGLMLLPGALLLGCTSVISGKIYDRYGVKIVLRGGFTLIAGVSLLISLMLSQDSSILILAVLYVFLMVGIGFIMTPVTAYAMASVPPQMIAHASPMTISIRSLASSMGGVLLIAIMTITMNYSSFTFPVNMMQGFHAAFWCLTVVAIAGLGLSFNLKGLTHS